MSKKIIFSAGGTGGHIFPAINLMKHFSEKGYKVLLVTDKRGNNFFKNYIKFKSYVLKTDTPTNKNFFKKILSFLVIFYSLIRSIIILINEKPNLIFGFGGYVSFPISFVSKFFNSPLVIYENNMVLGRTNEHLAPFAKKILVAKKISKDFPGKYKNKTHQVGSILNKDIINYPLHKKNNNKENFSILILGGSQGAEIFGTVIPPVIKIIKDEGYAIEVNQQCTRGQKKLLVDFYKINNIKNYVFEFNKDIATLISSADLAITRCGASTTAELAYFFVPFVAVPLPQSIDNHQYLNAKYYENNGYCRLLEQDNFNSESLFNLIIERIKNKNKLANISENIEKNYSKNVYSNIENEIKEFI